MSIPNRYYICFMYFLVRMFRGLSKWLEKTIWGYQWCRTCNGEGYHYYDGAHICEDCGGRRWYHTSLQYYSSYPRDCYCYLNNGKEKTRKLQIKGGNGKNSMWVVKCLKCNRKKVAKTEWLAILKWNQMAYPEAIKFIKKLKSVRKNT